MTTTEGVADATDGNGNLETSQILNSESKSNFNGSLGSNSTSSISPSLSVITKGDSEMTEMLLKPRTYKDFIKGISACVLYAIIQPISGVCIVYALDAGFNQFELLGLTGFFMTLIILIFDNIIHFDYKYYKYYIINKVRNMNSVQEIQPLLSMDNNNNNNNEKGIKSSSSSLSEKSTKPESHESYGSYGSYGSYTVSRLNSTDIWYMFHLFGGKQSGKWILLFSLKL